MYVLLIVVVLAILMTAFNVWADNRDILEVIFASIFTGLIVFLFSGLIMIGISSSIIDAHRNEYKWVRTSVTEHRIKSLVDNTNNIGGHFFLGCGSINSKSNYFYYEILNDSTSILNHIKTDGKKIIETNYRKPAIVHYEFKIDEAKTPVSNWLLAAPPDSSYDIIYVPKHTIVIQYKLDAK